MVDVGPIRLVGRYVVEIALDDRIPESLPLQRCRLDEEEAVSSHAPVLHGVALEHTQELEAVDGLLPRRFTADLVTLARAVLAEGNMPAALGPSLGGTGAEHSPGALEFLVRTSERRGVEAQDAAHIVVVVAPLLSLETL